MGNPKKLRASVKSIQDHGLGVFSLTLVTLDQIPAFRPGQFLHLAIDPFDPAGGFWPDSRVFSIARKRGDDELCISYSVKGHFTRRMRDELRPGSEVWIKMPYGEFVIDRLAGQGVPVALIAGGTGLTAFNAFLVNEIESRSQRRIRLYYGVRRPELVLSGDVLAAAKRGLDGFDLRLFVEEGAECADGLALPAATGRPGPRTVFEETRGLQGCLYFLAGPPPMVQLFQHELPELGISAGRIMVDNWE